MKIYQILLIVLAVFGAKMYVTCDFYNFRYWDEDWHRPNHNSHQELYCTGARLIGIIKNCLAAEGATKEDANDFYVIKPAANQNAKCFRACLMKECKFMDASGKFNHRTLRQYFPRFSGGDAAKDHLVSEVIDNCAATAKVEGNLCDTVDDYMTCYARNCKDCGVDYLSAFNIENFLQ